jgi:hypothetical protein
MTAGRNVVICHLAAGLLTAAEILSDANLKTIAQSQVHWVLGVNPRHIQIHGVKRGKTSFLFTEATMVENGPCGDELDNYNPNIGWWPADEVWMPNTGAFHLALSGCLPPIPEGAVGLGEMNAGVSAPDDGVGPAFIMFTDESVWTRFTAHPPLRAPRFENSNQLALVRQENGEWKYFAKPAWHPLATRASDVLLAEVDMTADTISMLVGVDEQIDGLQKGFRTGELWAYANRYAGKENPGEFTLTGTYFVRWNEKKQKHKP